MPRIRRATSGPSSGLLTQVELPAADAARRRLGRGGHRSHRATTIPCSPRSSRAATTRELAIAQARARRCARRASTASRPTCAYLRLGAASIRCSPRASRPRRCWRAMHSPRLSIEVLAAGTLTTVQDWPGRLGLWDVGVPPSGPMDALALRLANRMVGNERRRGGARDDRHRRRRCASTRDAVIALAGAQHGGDARWRAGAVLGAASPCSAAACSRSDASTAPASAPISRCAAASMFPSIWAAAPRSRSDSSAATAAARCARATCCG